MFPRSKTGLVVRSLISPKKVTMAWTMEQAQYRLPKVDLKAVTLSWLTKYLDSSMNVPGCYLELDTEGVKDRMDRKFSWQGEDVTWIEVVSRVADVADADVVISPGKVKLVPRKKRDGNAK